MAVWHPLPIDNQAFKRDADAVTEDWELLHRGDCEPLPNADFVAARRAEDPQGVDIDDDAKAAAVLLDAWTAYHNGEFENAVKLANTLGLMGAPLASKATAIYAGRIAEESERLDLLSTQMDHAKAAQKAFPDYVNAHYFLALLMGRYSQEISITKALAEGLAGKVHKLLEHTIKNAPNHAEAHSAMGVYHAEIIDKVGAMVGGLTYGVKPKKARDFASRAMELTPNSPIAFMEYGNVLYMLDGDKALDDVSDAYEKATTFTPLDAMDALDIAAALAEFDED